MKPSAYMLPSDIKKFETEETFAQAYSVPVGNHYESSVPLYRFEYIKLAIADACIAAEIPDSMFQSLIIALKEQGDW